MGLDVHLIDQTEPGGLFDVCQEGWHDGPMPKALPVIDTSAPICCAPVAAAPMDADAALEVAVRLKALADPVRVRLMSLLLASDEVCTCDLAPAVGLTEATVSHHLSVLRKAGLIDDGERRGMNVYYRARPDSLGALCRVLDPNCC
jgi:ArsR family transcriptional regulator, arsenate/arsenite/antimonite-responsive transcriptional repressor